MKHGRGAEEQEEENSSDIENRAVWIVYKEKRNKTKEEDIKNREIRMEEERDIWIMPGLFPVLSSVDIWNFYESYSSSIFIYFSFAEAYVY